MPKTKRKSKIISNALVKKTLAQYINNDTNGQGIDNALVYIETNKLVLVDKMVTVTMLAIFVDYLIDLKNDWKILIKKLTKASLIDLVNESLENDWDAAEVIKSLTLRLRNLNSQETLRKTIGDIRRAHGQQFTEWPDKLLDAPARAPRRSKRRRTASATATIPKYNKDNDVIKNQLTSQKVKKKTSQKKSQVAASTKGSKSKDSSKSKSVSTLGGEDSDAEDGDIDMTDNSNSQNLDEGEKDDGKEREEKNDQKSQEIIDQLNKLNLDPHEQASSSSSFTILEKLLPSHQSYHTFIVKQYYSPQYKFNNIMLYTVLESTIMRWRHTGRLDEELLITKRACDKSSSKSKSKRHEYGVESNRRKFLDNLSLKQTLQKLGIKGSLFTKHTIKMINDNHGILKHNTWWQENESLIRDRYISKYVNNSDMSFEDWVIWVCTLVDMPENLKDLDNSPKIQAVFRDPWKSSTLLGDLFSRIDTLNIEGVKIRKNVEFHPPFFL